MAAPTINIGVVGLGFGAAVLVPAFRTDPRVRVIALAATDADRASHVAVDLGVPRAYGRWQDLIADPKVDAVVLAVPPDVQAEIAGAALATGKAVFAEKPLAVDAPVAERLARQAATSGRANVVDFTFPEIPAWIEASRLIYAGALGALRHLVVHWHVETRANRDRLVNWKTQPERGGGTLGNFVSHALYNVEWLGGPIVALHASLFRAPQDGRDTDTFDVLALRFESGASASLSVSADAFLGCGHHVEVHGEDGTLVLDNPTADYMRGFTLRYGNRLQTELMPVAMPNDGETASSDGRVAPVARLAARFLDAIEKGVEARPNFRDGWRIQVLLEAARRSHRMGAWIDVRPDASSP